GAAFLHPTVGFSSIPVAHTSDELSRRRLAALTFATLIAPAIVVASSAGDQSYSILAGLTSGVMFLLVVARMAGLVSRIQDQADQMTVMARTDPLTGAGNRAAWNEMVGIELTRSKRLGLPVSIVMLDLDRFKDFNDRKGHLEGDQHLRDCVEAWRSRLRSIDTLTRFGGEEFLVLLPGCLLEDALKTSERLRSAVPHGETCSAGVARWDGEEGPRDLVARADGALYEAKHAGRDRSVAARSSLRRHVHH
ncbi:MAG TPA: GGDEF domain-containing protein, partial [Actinomycetota bacterium]|nr:GGDEF domain-containing protein [Actinomycetota bacterium]